MKGHWKYYTLRYLANCEQWQPEREGDSRHWETLDGALNSLAASGWEPIAFNGGSTVILRRWVEPDRDQAELNREAIDFDAQCLYCQNNSLHRLHAYARLREPL